MSSLMRYHRVVLILLLLTTNRFLVFPQASQMRFEHVSVEHGLSNFTPFSIIQDKFGFLWIGTEDGLNRYDGYSVKIYKHRPRDSASIAGNTITGSAVDRSGTLWLTASGAMIMRYDPDTDGFVHVSIRDSVVPKDFQLVSSAILPEENEDGLWIATNYGLKLFTPHTGRVKSFLHTPADSSTFWSNVITSLADDRKGGIWVGSSNGIHRLDKRSGKFRSYFPNHRHPHKGLSRDNVTAVAVDSSGTVWVGTMGGLLRYDTGKDEFTPVSFPLKRRPNTLADAFIVVLYVDASGELWIGTFHDGMLKHERATDSFTQYVSDPKNPNSLMTNRVICLYQDRSGVLWAGNYRAGLNKHNRREDQFTHYPSEDAVYATLEDSYGDLWVGTSGQGLLRYSKGGVADTFRVEPENPHSLNNNNIYSLCEERNGDLWIGTGIGLSRYVRAAGTFRNYSVNPEAGKNLEHTIKSLLIDSDDELWVGSLAMGLYRFNRQTGKFTAYMNNPNDSTSLCHNGIWSLFQDSKGRIWIGTFGGGVQMFDKATNKFVRRYTTRDDDSTTISGNAIYTIREDSRGNLWLGTFSAGVTKMNPETGKCIRYNDLNGLSDNFAKTILFDAKGNPWIGTDKGISFLDVETGQFEHYKKQDGLHNDVLLSGAAFKSRDGRFYFGGEGGVTAFYPDSLKRSSFKPSVVITSFQVFGKPFSLQQSIMQIPEIQLKHDENSFSFEFVSLDFSLPEKNQYAYRLDGIDHEWMYAGTRRYAGYSHLPPGEYTFRVIGTNSDGVWNFDGASTHIIINPPFWGTWWFRIGAVLALVGIAAAAYNYRVNRLLEIERLRVRIASDLHDDIGSSLTKISLQSELIQEGFEPEERENYLKNIATMSRELVTSMSDIVWSIDARNDTIENLLDKMRSFGLSTLSAKDIGFSMSHSGFDMKKRLSVDVRENIYLIFKEAINNIAKHANANSVNVVLRNDSDKCSMLIVDDGKGWEGTERPSGHGTKNMKMRAERLGGSIEFVKDEGTRVMLTMKRL